MDTSPGRRRRVRGIAYALGSVVLAAGVAVAVVAGGSTPRLRAHAALRSGAYIVTLQYRDAPQSPPLSFTATGFSVGVSAAGSPTGSAGGGSTTSSNEIVISKTVDHASNAIYQALQTGQTFATATVTNSRLARGVARFTMTLTSVRIVSITWSAAANDPPIEALSLSFGTIAWKS